MIRKLDIAHYSTCVERYKKIIRTEVVTIRPLGSNADPSQQKRH
jgi:hypothetical protein